MYIACLMAGTSSRLLPLTKADHKALLKVGNLRIIDVQMKTFAVAGLNTFSFVVGHGADRTASHLLANYSGLDSLIINNTYYALRNLDWSAFLALNSRPGDVIYYEGDIIASPEVIREVATHTADVCVAIDPIGQSASVDTLLIGNNDRPYELVFSEHGNLGKASTGRSEGEFLPFAKLSNRAREYVVGRLEKQLFDGPMTLYQIFNDLFQRFPSAMVSTAGRPWIEIDNTDDLLRAQGIVDRLFSNSAADSPRESDSPRHCPQ